MATAKKRIDFATSDEGIQTIEALQAMVRSKDYNTEATYSANTALYPDNSIPFIEKNMAYLQNHPNIDAKQYMSHLRLISRLR